MGGGRRSVVEIGRIKARTDVFAGRQTTNLFAKNLGRTVLVLRVLSLSESQ